MEMRLKINSFKEFPLSLYELYLAVLPATEIQKDIDDGCGEKYWQINLCAEYLDRPIKELAATLLNICHCCSTIIWETGEYKNSANRQKRLALKCSDIF